MGNPLLYAFARMDFSTGERVLSSDFDRMGDLAIGSLVHLLAWLFYDPVAGAPDTGFIGSSCSPSASGLVITVEAGIGFRYNSTSTDAFDVHYEPIVLATSQTVTLDAADPSNPRIDAVYLTPTEATDEASTRYVKDIGTGTVSSTSVNKRSRWTYTLAKVTGTPASSPSAPSIPSGSVLVAHCRVNAAAAAATVKDMRAQTTWSPSVPCDVTWGESFVPGSGSELQVTATNPNSMAIAVTPGAVVIAGTTGVKRRRHAPTANIAIAAADPTLPRLDLVVATESGVSVTTGTPNVSPSAPAPGAYEVPLATVLVDAAATTITGAKITDARVRQPVGSAALRSSAVTTTKIADDAITSAKIAADAVGSSEIAASAVGTSELAAGGVTGVKLSVPVGYLTVTVGVETAPSTRSVTIQLKDQDGNNLARVARVLVELRGTRGGTSGLAVTDLSLNSAPSTGTLVSASTGSGPGALIYDTDSNGTLVTSVRDLTDANADNWRILATGLNGVVCPGISASFGFAAGAAP